MSYPDARRSQALIDALVEIHWWLSAPGGVIPLSLFDVRYWMPMPSGDWRLINRRMALLSVIRSAIV